NKIAQSDTLKSKAYPSESSVVGTGTITVRVGDSDTGVMIDITESRNTLSRIRDVLNASGAAVNASIAHDSSGYRLLIAAKSSGTSNALNITVNDNDLNNSDANGLSAFAYDKYGAKNMEESQPPNDTALFANNSFYYGSSNTVPDAIAGVTMNLLGESGQFPVNVTVTQDTNGFIFGNLDAFVKAYIWDLLPTIISIR
ncbi:MAG: flagellar filament capping protein FliD, partial [Nitrospirae bacterium]|nr:flagellar filament capping protein FliD [Nitrospirota bacterium]